METSDNEAANAALALDEAITNRIAAALAEIVMNPAKHVAAYNALYYLIQSANKFNIQPTPVINWPPIYTSGTSGTYANPGPYTITTTGTPGIQMELDLENT